MRDGAVPEIFEGLPKYVSTPLSVTKSSISQLLEGQFINVCNQNHTLVATIEKYLINNEKYVSSCDYCGEEWITMVHKALLCFSNILLCDYCSAQTDKVSTTKIEKKRFPSSRIMSAFQYR